MYAEGVLGDVVVLVALEEVPLLTSTKLAQVKRVVLLLCTLIDLPTSVALSPGVRDT